MRIIEKGVNMDITPEIKNYLYKKLDHLSKFLDSSDESILCEVELGKTTNHHKNGDFFKAEINLHIPNKSLRVMVEKDDLFSAIDIAKDDMVRDLVSVKNKKNTLLRRGGTKVKNLIRGIISKR